MPRKNLVDRFVASVQSSTRKNFFDAKARGLVLRVGATSKTWYFTYRNGGPTEWVKIGTYPAVSLVDARLTALEQRHAIDLEGKDPAAERRRAPPEPAAAPQVFTFADFAPTFVAFQKGRVKCWRDDAAMLKRYLSPAWGPLPLKAITRTHVHEMLDTVAGKGLTIGVNRLQALISRIFTVALDRGLVDAHPAARVIKRFVEQPRMRVLSDDELRTLSKSLDEQPGVAADALRVRLLLGQRGGETAGMLWSELDLNLALWSLPGTRTKNRRPHVVPLPASALTILKRRRTIAPKDEPRVFPGLLLASDAHRALGTIHGGAYTWKDLRRTVATRLAGLGFDETTIGRVLNHARVTVTAKHYNQFQYVEEIRRALTAWDVELRRILANKATTKKAAVLRMRAR
jgi:integrase